MNESIQLMSKVVAALKERRIKANLDYPGYISINEFNFGTVDNEWGWDRMHGQFASEGPFAPLTETNPIKLATLIEAEILKHAAWFTDIDHSFKIVQDALGQDDGGYASIWVSGTRYEEMWAVMGHVARLEILTRYMSAERAYMQLDELSCCSIHPEESKGRVSCPICEGGR